MYSKVIVAIAVLILEGLEAKRNLIYGCTTCECSHKVPYLIKSYECHLEQHSGRVYGYGHIIFKRRLEAFDLRVNIIRNDSNIGDKNIINLRINICDFLSKKNRYLDFLMKPIRKYVNEIPRCPLKENFNYTLTRAYLDPDNFPAFMPIGNFTFVISFFEKGTEAGYFKLIGQVKQKEKKKHTKKGKE